MMGNMMTPELMRGMQGMQGTGAEPGAGVLGIGAQPGAGVPQNQNVGGMPNMGNMMQNMGGMGNMAEMMQNMGGMEGMQ
jgi:hypothetical protein